MKDCESKIRRALWKTFADTGSILDYLNYVNAVKQEERAKNRDQNQTL